MSLSSKNSHYHAMAAAISLLHRTQRGAKRIKFQASAFYLASSSHRRSLDGTELRCYLSVWRPHKLSCPQPNLSMLFSAGLCSPSHRMGADWVPRLWLILTQLLFPILSPPQGEEKVFPREMCIFTGMRGVTTIV